MIPYPHQLEGARWMAEKAACLNAFEMRVGKTATAIIAADYRMARRIVVVTTASGRAVWLKAFRDWSSLPRTIGLGAGDTDVQIVSWGEVIQGRTLSALMRGRIDVLILDESHNAKTFEAKRTCAVYGFPVGGGTVKGGLREHADAVWCLSGTPAPNALNDLYPMLAALSPSRLRAVGAAPDVSTYESFLKRYCRTKPKKIGFHRWIDVVIGSRNEDELRARMDGFVIRKTQADVGITLPIYELHPLAVSAKVRRQVEEGVDTASVMRAAEAGDTRALEMHLGPLRRLTGEIKARAVAEVVRDEMAGGLDKIVLMGWHKDALALLRSELSQFGVVGIDGTTSADERARAERRFRDEPQIKVFVGQIQAAGEAIDLSAASELMFVESSLVPKDMAQASKRITNFTQSRQPRVRVATLQGSIDEALQDILLRKWAGIREVIR